MDVEGTLKCLLLEMPQVRSVDALLAHIVQRVAEQPETALVRIWLTGPGDLCDECHMAELCENRERCMHLAASAGRPIAATDQDWSSLDGFFRRFPIGARKVGQIAATGEPVNVEDVSKGSPWIARPEWAEREEIRAFTGQPLIHQGEVLGVFGVFTRTPLEPSALTWLRMISDHAAVAIANARAFEEIDRLRSQLELENTYLRAEIQEEQAFGDIVGQSPALRKTIQQIELVAPTDASVLITGESGTGKELVAREIHRRSARSQRPMIRVNCASIPRELYESEFFGHVKGSFTGALRDRAGRFEAADQGTLFLDEVGEIPLDLQAKLLRVLQEGQYERVGDEATRHVDVRIIAATNRDLQAEVSAGRFREDLYYRLAVFPVEVVPLRERREDIPLLASHFLQIVAKKLNCTGPGLTQAHAEQLQGYGWPGNVRELQNVIERAVILSQCGHLQLELGSGTGLTASAPPGGSTTNEGEVVTYAELDRRERENLLAALEQTGWKVSGPGGAARLLGVKPTTLNYRIKKMGLEKRRG